MKKTFLLVAAAAVMNANAQSIVIEGEGLDRYYEYDYIPAAFTSAGSPLMVIPDETDDWDVEKVSVYDENMKLVKSFGVDFSNTFTYQRKYQWEKRDVKVVETYNDRIYTYGYNQFLDEHVRRFGLTEEAVKQVLLNGTQILCVDFSGMQDTYHAEQLNREYYFAYKSFGMVYPRMYWIQEADGMVTMCRADYMYNYISDWYATATEVVDCSEEQTFIELAYVNFNIGQDDLGAEYVTQTLFNEDESFEYLLPKYKLSTNGLAPDDDLVSGIYPEDEPVITRRTLTPGQGRVVLAGFQIVSDNGTVVNEILFDDNFEGDNEGYGVSLMVFGDNIYLTLAGNQAGKPARVFYKINRTAASIEKVKVVPSSMKLAASRSNRNSTITVTLGDENKGGSDIVVVSAAGQTIKRASIPSMQQSATLKMSMPAGVYNIGRLQKGNVTDSKKFIVK